SCRCRRRTSWRLACSSICAASGWPAIRTDRALTIELGAPSYVNVIYIHDTRAVMDLATRLDDTPKPFLLALVALGFVAYWPLGLGMLVLLMWSKRMGCGRHWHGRWHYREGMERARERAQEWFRHGPRSSGNVAFDEYRVETLKRLEEEERE